MDKQQEQATAEKEINWKDKTSEEIIEAFGKKVNETFPKGFFFEAINRAVIVSLIRNGVVTIDELVETIQEMNELLRKNAPPQATNPSNIIVPDNPSFNPQLMNDLKRKGVV